jgi:hypothetical protein
MDCAFGPEVNARPCAPSTPSKTPLPKAKRVLYQPESQVQVATALLAGNAAALDGDKLSEAAARG